MSKKRNIFLHWLLIMASTLLKKKSSVLLSSLNLILNFVVHREKSERK